MSMSARDASAGGHRATTCCCVSAVSLAICISAAVAFAQYSPLYRPVQCMQQGSWLGPLQQVNAEWVTFAGAMKQECNNPNNYPLDLIERSEGQVYLLEGNDTLLPVGLIHVSEGQFPPKEKVIVESRLNITVRSAKASTMLASPVLRVVTKTKVHVEADLRFFGIVMLSGEDQEELCGCEMRLATKKAGPSACAATLDQLVIPDMDSIPKLEFVRISQKALAVARTKRNVDCGLVLVVAGLACLISAILAVRQLWSSCQQAREPELIWTIDGADVVGKV